MILGQGDPRVLDTNCICSCFKPQRLTDKCWHWGRQLIIIPPTKMIHHRVHKTCTECVRNGKWKWSKYQSRSRRQGVFWKPQINVDTAWGRQSTSHPPIAHHKVHNKNQDKCVLGGTCRKLQWTVDVVFLELWLKFCIVLFCPLGSCVKAEKPKRANRLNLRVRSDVRQDFAEEYIRTDLAKLSRDSRWDLL